MIKQKLINYFPAILILLMFVFGVILFLGVTQEMEKIDSQKEIKCSNFCGENEYFFSKGFFGSDNCVCSDTHKS